MFTREKHLKFNIDNALNLCEAFPHQSLEIYQSINDFKTKCMVSVRDIPSYCNLLTFKKC